MYKKWGFLYMFLKYVEKKRKFVHIDKDVYKKQRILLKEDFL